MLGHRGCRLAITYTEICEMQARAIFEAAAEVGEAPRNCQWQKSWCHLWQQLKN